MEQHLTDKAIDEMKSSNLIFRVARKSDLFAIVQLLADDALGSQRESIAEPLDPRYLQAFDAIEADPNNELVVATINDEVVGVLQLTFIPNLTHTGSWRAQVEGVRVSSEYRSLGIGGKLLDWSLARCRERNCHLAQLTTDLRRPEALDFYQRLGFEHTHAGMKRWLNAD